jgi:hypothetical protein
MTYKGHNLTINKKGYYRFSSGSNRNKYLHRVIYEKHYGPIPKGYDIHHKDGDKSNTDPENLECMTKAEHTKLHKLGKKRKEITNLP